MKMYKHFWMARSLVKPPFLFKGFFQKEFKVMDEMPLPAVAAFLQSQLEHITEVELTFGCFVVGCDNKF